jgi:hypothetical protein
MGNSRNGARALPAESRGNGGWSDEFLRLFLMAAARSSGEKARARCPSEGNLPRPMKDVRKRNHAISARGPRRSPQSRAMGQRT